jgi:hypothetical protein
MVTILSAFLLDTCVSFWLFQHEDHSMTALRLGRGTGAVQIAEKEGNHKLR